jgi:hypothetical protein
MTTVEMELNHIRRACESRIRWFVFSSRIRQEINRKRNLVKRRMTNFQVCTV